MSVDLLERSTADDPEWKELLQRTRACGRLLGVESEDDVERITDEFREQKRRLPSDDSHLTQ